MRRTIICELRKPCTNERRIERGSSRKDCSVERSKRRGNEVLGTACFLSLNMILNSRQTVVMMIPRTPIEYIITMTETKRKGEMKVIGGPSCGGIPNI